jgi:Type II secretory pathway, component PulF
MTYPALLLMVGFGSVLVLLNFVVPRFASVFEESHMKIPLPTQMMLDASKFVQAYWLPAAIALVCFIAAFRTYVKTASGQMWWDTMISACPAGRRGAQGGNSSFRASHVHAGCQQRPAGAVDRISAAILNNKKMAGALEGVSLGVKRGEGIAAPLRRSSAFPALAGHLLSVGEETGRLDQMFSRMADIYESDTKTAIRRFTSLFEPLVILVMGIMVGGLILSMLLAITSINDVVV